MSSDYTCPVDGCDYGTGEPTSLRALRSHINAHGDDAHDWEQLKPEILDVDATEEPDEDQPEASESDGDGSDSEAEADSDMADHDEYQTQHEQATNDEGGESDESTGASIGDDGFQVALPVPNLSTTHLMLIMLAAVLFVLAYAALSSSDTSSGGTTTDPDEEGSAELDGEELSLDPDDVDGGLVDV